MSYWKFTSAESLASWDEMVRQEEELKKQGSTFAALFDGKPVYQKTMCDWRFYGVRFDGHVYVAADLWTRPTSKNGYAQQPRVKVPAALKRESEALWQLWNAQRPHITADREAFYESIGLDWGNLMFCGFASFRYDGVIYVETGATPKPEAGGVEILGSEYAAAQRAAKAGDNVPGASS